MKDASLALQTFIRDRLKANTALTVLVPVDNIRDSTGLKERLPAVMIGEGQTVYDDFKLKSYATLHIWVAEVGLTQAKAIEGAIRTALKDRPWIVADHLCHDLRVLSAQFLRDGKHGYSHGVVSISSIMQERAGV